MSDTFASKQDVLRTCLILAGEGYIPGTGGNVALRVDDSRFAITPSAADYYSMSPDDICILELPSLKPIEGTRQPSVEAGLHARFLRARPDVRASVHTHQPIASAVTLLGRSLDVDDPASRDLLGPRIPIVPYAPSGTGILAWLFQRTIRKNCHAYLLRNHGVVCGAKTLDEAIARVRGVERVAERFLRNAIQSSKQTTALPQGLREAILTKLNSNQ